MKKNQIREITLKVKRIGLRVTLISKIEGPNGAAEVTVYNAMRAPTESVTVADLEAQLEEQLPEGWDETDAENEPDAEEADE